MSGPALLVATFLRVYAADPANSVIRSPVTPPTCSARLSRSMPPLVLTSRKHVAAPVDLDEVQRDELVDANGGVVEGEHNHGVPQPFS